MQYLVYRRGSNAANQPMCNRLPLCLVEAERAAEARRIAEEYHVFYPNQYSEVVPSRTRRKDSDSVVNSLDNHIYRNDKGVIKHPAIVATVEPQLAY